MDAGAPDYLGVLKVTDIPRVTEAVAGRAELKLETQQPVFFTHRRSDGRAGDGGGAATRRPASESGLIVFQRFQKQRFTFVTPTTPK